MDHPRISRDREVMMGKPVIRGTRITVELVLRLLAKGHTVEELARSYRLEPEDIHACQGFAADLLAEQGNVAAE